MGFETVLYEESGPLAVLTLNRPDKLNAINAQMVAELGQAMDRAEAAASVRAIVLRGAGRAFSAGFDLDMGEDESGDPIGFLRSELRKDFDIIMRFWDCPKPTIAAVHKYCLGSAMEMAVACDITIAAENARFGQTGPRVGSFDGGYGASYMARIVGQKKAREIWYLCRQYTAQQALEMGLVNIVVPNEELDAEIERWCAEIMERSPTAIAIAKRSFNADSEALRAVGALGFEALALFYKTEESKEGGAAFREKRKPEFRKKRGS